ncbi:hypothetical protein [Microlunatus parietis]|uniref:Lon protease-like protein n=1 Tax=Microlunatus parietis TaxID=682979 RepID=A0A7Y9L8V7_9ACTN|nr:hypothetical protein [Microlunatus parietis]NYE68882.1 Lon protease-like protein [Microlunatus parietis]
MHPSTGALLRYFEHDHLPAKLETVSVKFYQLANSLAVMLPNGPETTVALRKLLEAKDAAVRSALDLDESGAK